MHLHGFVPWIAVLFGKMTPQPLDADFKLPRQRRIFWEYGQDLAAYLSFSVLINVILASAVGLMAVVLVVIYRRPPVVLAEEQGYVFWRTTEQYKLRSSIVKTYVQAVTSTLLTIQPGAYDLSSLVGLADIRVLKVFSSALGGQADERLRANRRQLWRVLEVKRYYDPKLPKYLTLAVRGERALYEEKRTDLGGTDLRTNSSIQLYVMYLDQILPTATNPWGLRTVGLAEIETPSEQERIWSASYDLQQTVDQKGQLILPPRSSDLSTPD